MRAFRFEVYDQNLVKQGRISKESYLTADVVPKHNAIGSWSILMDLDDAKTGGYNRKAQLLAQPGRRVVIDFEEGGRLMSGPVDSWEEIEEVGGKRTIAIAGYDDKWWLDQRLAFPTPDATFPADGTAFTQADYVDIRTGPGESVAKAFVQANAVDRLAIPHLVVAPDAGRGTTVSYNARMHQLLWMVFISTTYSGLGFTVDQIDGELVFDVYEPADHPVRLSKKLGNLESYRYKALSPVASRGVAGGAGEGIARRYIQKSLASSAVGWGIREKFLDASDAETEAALLVRLTAFLAESAPTAGFSLTPRDSRSMTFGVDYKVGDRVRVELPNGLVLADTVREARLSHTTDAGMQITPGVGYSESTDPTAAIYRTYAALRDEVANMKRRV